MVADRGDDFLAAGDDRQRLVIDQRRDALLSPAGDRQRLVELLVKPVELLVRRLALQLGAFNGAQQIPQSMPVGLHRLVDLLGDFTKVGHSNVPVLTPRRMEEED